MATAQVILLAGAVVMSRKWRNRAPEAWWALAGWGTATAVLMFSVSFFLYRILPELRFVQLPLRWLLCLNVAFVLLVAMSSRRWLVRSLVCVVMLITLAWVWHRVQPPWWDTTADVAEMQDNQHSGAGYEGTDEYVPTGADAYEIDKNAPLVALEKDSSSRVSATGIHINRWAPEGRSFTANLDQPAKLVLKLFNHPAWKVEVNGRPVKTETVELTGQMVVPLEAGESRAEITFIRTPDRTIGWLISFGTIVLILGWIFVRHFFGTAERT